jgi:integrase
MAISEFYLKGATKEQLEIESSLPRDQRTQTVRTIYYYFRWGAKDPLRYCTKERIKQCDWDEQVKNRKDKWETLQRVNSRITGAEKINLVLDEIESKVTKAERDYRASGIVPKLSQLKAVLIPEIKKEDPKSLTFFQMFEGFIKYATKANKENFGKTLSHLKEFNPNLNWHDLTKEFYSDYINFLSKVLINTRTGKPGILNNTMGKDTKHIIRICKEGLESGISFPLHFLKFKRPKYDALTETRRHSIEEKQLEHILSFDYDNKDLYTWRENIKKSIPNIYMVRDMYTFSFYTGLAYKEISRLTPDQIVDSYDETGLPIKVIDFSRSKSKTHNSIPLNQICLDLIEKYKGEYLTLFRYFHVNHYNRISKRMFKMAGFTKRITLVRWSGDREMIESFQEWELLTSHSARHSAAENIIENSDDITLVRDFLGHKSTKTTELYTKKKKKKFYGKILKITEGNSKLKVG